MSAAVAKNARVDFRIAAEQKEMIEKAARLSGLSVSDFIVSKTVAAAAEVLERQNRVVLSERDWARFLEALDAESEPAEAAKRAAARYNEGRVEGNSYTW